MSDTIQNLAVLENLWDRSLNVGLIAEPLQCVSGIESAKTLKAKMSDQNWDTIGLRNDTDSTKGASAYITRESLADGLCGQYRRDFCVHDLVSIHMPIRDCLARVVERRWIFVLGRHGVDSIVTIADLQKQPVRLMLFAGVSLLEIAIGDIIRKKYPDGAWQSLLSEPRLDKAIQLQALRRQKDQELDLVSCLQICDKAAVLLRQNGIWHSWGFESKNKALDFFRAFQDLRDTLAHAQDLDGPGGWAEICSTFAQAENMLRVLSGEMKIERGEGDAD